MTKKRNFARNFQEGIFKLCEINMDISAKEHAFIDSKAQWFSADQNSAKQRFFFTEDGESRNLSTVGFMRIVYEFPDHNSEWQMIDWPITDPDRGMVEMILPDQILTVGTTEMLQHVYLIQPSGWVPDIGDTPDEGWEDQEEWGVLKKYKKFDTQDAWTDVGIVHSNVNLSFVDKDMEPMREFYIQRFEDVKREIYEVRDRVMEILGEVDVDEIVAEAINIFLETNSMPTVEHVNSIHLSLLAHIVDNIRHVNPEDRSNINRAMNHIDDQNIHLSQDDRQGVEDAKFHARNENIHLSPSDRAMLERVSELDPDNQEAPEFSIDMFDGLRETLETMQADIDFLKQQVESLINSNNHPPE